MTTFKTTYMRGNAGSGIVAFMRSMIGRIPYSEQSPQGSDADGHNWFPGMAPPKDADCSGSVIMGMRVVGIDTSNGNAAMLYQEFADVRIPATEPLEPGDIGVFLGSGGTHTNPGHIAVVATINNTSGLGTVVGEYDTALGWCEIHFSRGQAGNGSNGLGVVGFFRPANRLKAPAPTPPAPKPKPRPPVPPQTPTMEKAAAAQGLVEIDAAEATLAINASISYYTWQAGHFVGSRSPKIPTGVVLYTFAKNLDSHHIPHAGP